MLLNVYIANHGKRDGVEDYLTILGGVIARHGHEMVISERLRPDIINIVIDEFTNFICNEEIIAFRRQHPHARMIFVLTEFIETRLLVKTFNFFGGPLEAAAIAAMNIYLRLYRKDFLPPSFGDWVIAAAYSPLLFVYYILHRLKNLRSKRPVSLISRLHRRAYMLMRYLGLEKMIDCADGVILSHGMIEAGIRKLSPTIPVLGILHPEIIFEEIKNTLFIGKHLYIEITGSITPYRRKYADEINHHIMKLGTRNIFHMCRIVSWADPNSSETYHAQSIERRSSLSTPSSTLTKREKGDAWRAAYSLHPPQSHRWQYSSPTRIFRALQYDHNMPVLTRLFDQHPIERLCLVFDGKEALLQMYRYYHDPDKLFAYLEPRAQEYVRIATKANDTIIAAMVDMAECGGTTTVHASDESKITTLF
jgi:hypothetical protein